MTAATRNRPSRTPGWGTLAMFACLLAAGAAAAQTAVSPGRDAAGLLVTHAEAYQRLPNTVSDASISIEVHGRDLRATATLLARQSQSLLTFLRDQRTERLRTEVASFAPELQEARYASVLHGSAKRAQ